MEPEDQIDRIRRYVLDMRERLHITPSPGPKIEPSCLHNGEWYNFLNAQLVNRPFWDICWKDLDDPEFLDGVWKELPEKYRN